MLSCRCMITANNTVNHLELLLQLLSLIQPVSSGGQLGEKNKKTTDFFNDAISQLRQRIDRNMALDHSVKIIKTLLCHQYGPAPTSDNAESNLYRPAEQSSPKPVKNDTALRRLIQSSVAQIIHISPQEGKNPEQFAQICQAAARLIDEMNQLMLALTKDGDINQGDSTRSSMREIAAVQLKPAMDRLISSIENFEGCQAAKEVSRQTIERKEFTSQISKPGKDSSEANLKTGERQDSFRSPTSELSQKRRGELAFKPLPFSVKPAAVPIVNTAPAVPLSASSPQFLEAKRSRSDTTPEPVAIRSIDVTSVPIVAPYPGSFSTSSNFAARRKKEKKKHPEDEEREENESLSNSQEFEF